MAVMCRGVESIEAKQGKQYGLGDMHRSDVTANNKLADTAAKKAIAKS